MAWIENTGEAECYEGTWRTIYRFIGRGWAKMHLPYDWRGQFEPVIFHGNLWLRILYADRGFPGWLCVVESDNWRWPLWWLLLRPWRFLCWLERNMRLTACIWGLLKCDIACVPRWRDFVLLWWVRKEAKKWIIKVDFSPMAIWLEILCLVGFFVLCAWWQQGFSENGEFEAWVIMWLVFLGCSLIGVIESIKIKKHRKQWPPS